VIKAAFKKATKSQGERIEITVELTPDYQKDYEIIPFHRDEAKNKVAIAAFMAKYITKPFEYLENVVGVEINFNIAVFSRMRGNKILERLTVQDSNTPHSCDYRYKVFYKPEKLRSVGDILGDIASLDQELGRLEQGLLL